MSIIDFSEFFLPDGLIIIEGTLFLIRTQMFLEEGLDSFQERS